MKAIAPLEFKLVHRYTEHKTLKWHKQRDRRKVLRHNGSVNTRYSHPSHGPLSRQIPVYTYYIIIIYMHLESNAPPVYTWFWGSPILWLLHTTNAVWSSVFDHFWSQILIVSPEMDMNLRWAKTRRVFSLRVVKIQTLNHSKSNIKQNILIST